MSRFLLIVQNAILHHDCSYTVVIKLFTTMTIIWPIDGPVPFFCGRQRCSTADALGVLSWFKRHPGPSSKIAVYCACAQLRPYLLSDQVNRGSSVLRLQTLMSALILSTSPFSPLLGSFPFSPSPRDSPTISSIHPSPQQSKPIFVPTP